MNNGTLTQPLMIDCWVLLSSLPNSFCWYCAPCAPPNEEKMWKRSEKLTKLNCFLTKLLFFKVFSKSTWFSYYLYKLDPEKRGQRNYQHGAGYQTVSGQNQNHDQIITLEKLDILLQSVADLSGSLWFRELFLVDERVPRADRFSLPGDPLTSHWWAKAYHTDGRIQVRKRRNGES